MVFDMDLICGAAAWPNRIKLLMLFDMVSCFASFRRKTFDQDHAFSIRNLIICDIPGSNIFRESQFSIGFLIFWDGFLKSQLDACGTKILHYTRFDIWYLIPIWYQNLMSMDQIRIISNLMFDIWVLDQNLILIWFDIKFSTWSSIWSSNLIIKYQILISFWIKFDHQIWYLMDQNIWSIKIWSQIWFDPSILIGGGYQRYTIMMPARKLWAWSPGGEHGISVNLGCFRLF